jgi:hypothetical protein
VRTWISHPQAGPAGGRESQALTLGRPLLSHHHSDVQVASALLQVGPCGQSRYTLRGFPKLPTGEVGDVLAVPWATAHLEGWVM